MINIKTQYWTFQLNCSCTISIFVSSDSAKFFIKCNIYFRVGNICYTFKWRNFKFRQIPREETLGVTTIQDARERLSII